MLENRRRQAMVLLGSVLAASLVAGSLAGPVAAAPDPDKAEQRAVQKAEREAARAERKADLAARKAERAALREARKAALEERKAEAKALRTEARAEIAAQREGFSDMTVDERKAVLAGIREARESYKVLFFELMGAWHTERTELLPNTLSDTPDDALAEPSEELDPDLETEAAPEED